jgi:large subunit ribosomal protein L47
MLGLSRGAPKRVYFISRRSFAEVVATLTLRDGKVPVREDHGLWHFFRRKRGENLEGDACYETVEHPSKVEQSRTGRAWKASELRLKSFDDLHTLWYIVLRERNLLATQKEEARRMGVSDTGLQVSAERVHQCRKTMARIKAVLNERRLAYEGALKLIEEQKQQAEDEVVLQYQRHKFEEERTHSLSRRELTERRRKARLRTEAEARTESTEAELPQEVRTC